MAEVNTREWNEFLSHLPDAHILQTAAWGELKAAFGWQVVRLVTGRAGAQVLFRRLPLGFSVAYIPKGPVGQEPVGLWPLVDALCRKRRAVFLKVEPDSWQGANNLSSPPPGFRASPQAIQPSRTLVVDLRGEETELLGRMKPKTRYNIRLAQRKGVVVRPSGDIETFNSLIRVTGERDRFDVHAEAYYRQAYQLFYPHGGCELLVAEYQGEPLAALMVFVHGRRAWYFYGASSNAHRNRMPTYLLQWEAMRWARARGCELYDLWGVPNEEEQVLEANFSQRSDGLWGVYRFKRGFGGQLRRATGPWDQVYRPSIYALYLFWLKRHVEFSSLS